jgi:hypothetical protein
MGSCCIIEDVYVSWACFPRLTVLSPSPVPSSCVVVLPLSPFLFWSCHPFLHCCCAFVIVVVIVIVIVIVIVFLLPVVSLFFAIILVVRVILVCPHPCHPCPRCFPCCRVRSVSLYVLYVLSTKGINKRRVA